MNPFRPATWLPGGHLQTLFNPLLRKPPSLQRQRVRMTLSDGDYLDLDWHGSTQQSAPIAILLHGLTGSSASLYILGQQRALAAVGAAAPANLTTPPAPTTLAPAMIWLKSSSTFTTSTLTSRCLLWVTRWVAMCC